MVFKFFWITCRDKSSLACFVYKICLYLLELACIWRSFVAFIDYFIENQILKDICNDFFKKVGSVYWPQHCKSFYYIYIWSKTSVENFDDSSFGVKRDHHLSISFINKVNARKKVIQNKEEAMTHLLSHWYRNKILN